MIRSLAVWALAFACAVAPVAAVWCPERCEPLRAADRLERTAAATSCHRSTEASPLSASRITSVHRCAHDHGATPALRAPRPWASGATRVDFDHATVVANAVSGTRASLDVRFNHGPPFFTDWHPRIDTRVVLRV